MKKYMKFMAFAMLAVFSLAFTSCGNDDDGYKEVLDPIDFDQIEINGEKQKIYGTFDWSDVWTLIADLYKDWDLDELKSHYGGEDYYLDVNEAYITIGSLKDESSYLFSWTCPYEPKKGDVISDMKNFVMEPDIVGQKKDIEYSYSSGTAKVVDTNVAKEKITVQFDNLKMVNGSNSFTFNGKVVFSFDYSELH